MAWFPTDTVPSSPRRFNSVPNVPTSASSPSSPAGVEDGGGIHLSLAASNLERQADELLLLQSVFMSDFEDLRGTNVWKTQRPTEASLRLSPSGGDGDGSGVFAEIQMRVKCTLGYPADPPEIALDKEKGLSKDQVKQLSSELTSLASSLSGEVMIYDLAQHVQAFLHKHNVPPAKSFHEQMISNQKKKEERKKEEERRKQEEERKKLERQARDVDEEIEKTQRALKEERKGRKTLTFNPEDDIIEFERTRFDSYVGSGTDDDGPPTTPTRAHATTTAITIPTATTASTASPTAQATSPSPNRVASRKSKPLKDGIDDRRLSVKASSPVLVKLNANVANAKNGEAGNNTQSGRRPRLSSSDNSEGCGSPSIGTNKPDDCLKSKNTPPDPPHHTHSPSTSPSVSSGDSGNIRQMLNPCHRGTTYLTFALRNESRTVLRGRCIGHGPRGSFAFIGMDKSNGDLVAIKEWRVSLLTYSSEKVAKKKLSANITKAIQETYERHGKALVAAENELLSLSKLNHDSIVAFQGIKSFLDHTDLVIQVLEDFVEGSNLGSLLADSNPVAISRLKVITSGILNAFDFLHDHAIVHKDLRPSSIFIDRNQRIRLADFSLDKKLYDIVCTITNATPVDALPLPMGRSGKKQDVYRLGLLLLSLAQGSVVKEMVPDIASADFTQKFPLLLCDFLLRCLDQDERSRWSVKQLLDHDFLKQLEEDAGRGNKGESGKKEKEKEEAEEEEEEIPIVTSADASGHSRLSNEFEVLRWIGKGGFGDVIKVRNKLDAGLYAIKRIPLNPKSKQLTKKITREVKLLSRLNHDNVVRYFNSWIETCKEDFDPGSTTDTTANSTPISNGDGKLRSPSGAAEGVRVRVAQLKMEERKENSLGLVDDVEMNVPPPADTDSWGKSETDGEGEDEDEDDDEDDDDMDVFGFSFGFSSDSEENDAGVVFDRSGPNWHSPAHSGVNQEDLHRVVSPTKSNAARWQYLYIQMEFCEKSTLRNAIDSGELHKDVKRVWKLFREIVEGLSYIHDQGLIHRDLKPVNVFLSSDDHVKIGDFGLATTRALSSATTAPTNAASNSPVGPISPESAKSKDPEYRSRSQSGESALNTGDESLTGKVGTALYVAPELMNASSCAGNPASATAAAGSTGGGRLIYTQKVDMYSLGICFFEMCYRPLDTGMERITIISNLRLPAIQFPEPTADFDLLLHKSQARVIRWLLTHDVSVRPSAAELLSSDYLPRPPLEEAQFVESLKRALAQTGSANYHKLMGNLFERNQTLIQDQCWDLDPAQNKSSSSSTSTWNSVSSMAREEAMVTSRLEAIFTKHGGVQVKTPLLLPKSLPIVDSRVLQFDQTVQLLDSNGSVSLLPYSLRLGFARYVARREGVARLKRYAIDRVYHARRITQHVHPKEFVECAFDVVTESPGNLIADAEIILVAQEVITAFPTLGVNNFLVKLNHPQLVKAILLHHGVPEEKFPPLFQLLTEARSSPPSKFKVQLELDKLFLQDTTIEALYALLFETEGPLSRVAAAVRPITKSKGLASSLARTGLHELETVLSNCAHLGVKLQLVVDLGMVNFIQHFSSVFFCVCSTLATKMPRKKTSTAATRPLLAVGGRYDDLVALFRRPTSTSGATQQTTNDSTTAFSTAVSDNSKPQCVAGISMAFATLLAALQEESEVAIRVSRQVFVASLGHRLNLKESLQLLRCLWSLNISADLASDPAQSVEDLHAFCRAEGVSCLVLFKDDGDDDVSARLYLFLDSGGSGAAAGRWIEKRYTISELPEVIHQHLKEIRVAAAEAESSRLTGSAENGAGDIGTAGINVSGISAFPSSSSSSAGSSGFSVGNSSFLSSSSSSTSPSFALKYFPLDIRFALEEAKKDPKREKSATNEKNDKKRHESKIHAKINSSLLSHQFRTMGPLPVVATDLPLSVVRTIAAYVDLSASVSGVDGERNAAGAAIVERHPRYRKYVEEVLDLVFDLRWITGKGSSGGGGGGKGTLRPVILFSLKDDGFKILM